MKEEESKKRIGYNSILENTFKTIIIKVCRYYAETNLPGPRKKMKMGIVIDYLYDHYHEKISRDELVDVADMPCATFCRSFKETTGLSPMNYLIRFRIEKAAELLAENKKIRITDVATQTGFENSAYFSRKFKEILGVAPREYHKKQHETIDLNGSDEFKE
jgi:transcriptional regulator GlxA family with amidase domain